MNARNATSSRAAIVSYFGSMRMFVIQLSATLIVPSSMITGTTRSHSSGMPSTPMKSVSAIHSMLLRYAAICDCGAW